MHILNNWKVLQVRSPDGSSLICMEGRVRGSNPRFPCAALIRTSSVIGYRLKASSMIIVTSRGSEYLLGKPDPAEPCSEQGLMARLPKDEPARSARVDGKVPRAVVDVPGDANETVMLTQTDVSTDGKA